MKELDEKELREFVGKHCRTKDAINKFLTHFSHKIAAKPEEKCQVMIGKAIWRTLFQYGRQGFSPAL